MTNKSDDDMNAWAEFVRQLDQSQHTSKQCPDKTLVEREAWDHITQQIHQLNHHRNAYVAKSQSSTIKQKSHKLIFGEFQSFHGMYTLDENVPNLDRDDKKHLNKVMSHQISVVDLHGCTLVQGYEKLKWALSHAIQNKSKILKVITGKGRPNPEPENPTLKAIFPKWMQEPYFKTKVYKVRIASISHGGEGACLVYLKYSSPSK